MALPWCIYMHTKRLDLLETTSVTRGYSKPGLINNYFVSFYNYNKLILDIVALISKLLMSNGGAVRLSVSMHCNHQEGV